MVELKTQTTKKINLKDLVVNGDMIVDEEGNVKDLNKIVTSAFRDGDIFTFTVNVKDEVTDIVEE